MKPLLLGLLLGFLTFSGARAENPCTAKARCKILLEHPTPKYDSNLQEIYSRVLELIKSEAKSPDLKFSVAAKESIQARLSVLGLKVVKNDSPGVDLSLEEMSVYASTAAATLSPANLVHMLAHEAAHSIDWESTYYVMVSTSAGGPYVSIKKEMLGTEGWPMSIKFADAIDPAEYATVHAPITKLGVNDDRIVESFADVMATRVMVKYLQTLSEAEQKSVVFEAMDDLLVDVCKNDAYLTDSHLRYMTTQFRYESLYFGNPTISKIAGCNH